MGKFGRVFCKQTNVAACRFQNECNNKVEIALRVVQFWSEIKLVITNCNHAFDFRPNCTPLSGITIINLSNSLNVLSRRPKFCLFNLHNANTGRPVYLAAFATAT